MRSMQDQDNGNVVRFSSNVKPSALCSRHSELPARTNPVFLCAECGMEFCPRCCGRPWLEFEAAGRRVLWYRCPRCPVGLAFIMLPKTDSFSAETSPNEGDRDKSRVVRRGVYEVLHDGSGNCLVVLDGKERYAWVQKADSVHLIVDLSPIKARLLPAQKGAYLLADHGPGAADGAGLFLYLQFPHGYQEYRLPQGWPDGGEARRLEVTPRALSDRELEQWSLPDVHHPQRCKAKSTGIQARAA